MKDWLKNPKSLFVLTVILLLGIGIRLYWANEKVGMDIDEAFSFAITECDGAYNMPDAVMHPDTVLTGKEFKSLCFIHDTRIKGVLHDLRYLWYNNFDYNHTNFYYSILRVWFAGTDTTDIHTINMRGIMLNVLFFIITYFVFLVLLLFHYKSSPHIVYLTMLCFSMMAGGVSDTLFIRPYELQMLMVCLLALWLSYVMRDIRGGNPVFTLRHFLVTTVALAAVLWTGYFMVIYVCVLGLFLIYELYRVKALRKGLPYYVGTALCSVLLCRVLYLSYFLGFGGDNRITEKLTGSGAIVRLWDSVVTWGSLLLDNTLYLPVLLLIVGIIVCLRKRWQGTPWVFWPTLVATLIITLVAPYETNRYIVSLTPLLLLLIPATVNVIARPRLRIICMVAIGCVYAVYPMSRNNIKRLYPQTEATRMLSSDSGRIHIVQRYPWDIFFLLSFMDDDIAYQYRRSTTIDTTTLKRGDIVFYSAYPDSASPIPLAPEKYRKIGRYEHYDVCVIK